MEKERDLWWCQFTYSKGFSCWFSCFRPTNSATALLSGSTVKSILTALEKNLINYQSNEPGIKSLILQNL